MRSVTGSKSVDLVGASLFASIGRFDEAMRSRLIGPGSRQVFGPIRMTPPESPRLLGHILVRGMLDDSSIRKMRRIPIDHPNIIVKERLRFEIAWGKVIDLRMVVLTAILL